MHLQGGSGGVVAGGTVLGLPVVPVAVLFVVKGGVPVPGLSVGKGGIPVSGLSVGKGGIPVSGLSVGKGGIPVSGLSVGKGGIPVYGLSVGIGGIPVSGSSVGIGGDSGSVVGIGGITVTGTIVHLRTFFLTIFVFVFVLHWLQLFAQLTSIYRGFLVHSPRAAQFLQRLSLSRQAFCPVAHKISHT